MIIKYLELNFLSEKKRELAFNLIFVLGIAFIYYLMGYIEMSKLDPFGIHFIRQTDSLSFIETYYKHNMNFFEPRGYSLFSTDGKGISEFPLIYYFTAMLYFIFGESPHLFRFINLIIGTFGFYYLYKSFCLFSEFKFINLLLTFLIISSPVIFYYNFNFIPDSSSFSTSIIAWYFFLRYVHKNDNTLKTIILFSIFFLYASTTKAYYIIQPASAAFFILIKLFFIEKKRNFSYFLLYLKKLLPFIIILILTLIWYQFILKYNTINKNDYFLSHFLPFSWEDRNLLFEYFNLNKSVLYHPDLLHFIAILIVLSLILYKYINKNLYFLLLLIIISNIVYLYSFFYQFKYHDYYYLNFFYIAMFSFLILIQSLHKHIKNKKNIYIIFSTFILFFVFISYLYSKKRMNERINNYQNRYSDIFTSSYYEIMDSKDSIQNIISKNDKILVIGDQTRQGSLYGLRQQGWTLGFFHGVNEFDIHHFNNLNYIISTNDTLLENVFNSTDSSYNIIKRYEKNTLKLFQVIRN